MRKTHAFALVAALWFPLHSLAFAPSASGNAVTYGGFTATPANVGQFVVSTASDGRVLVSQPARMPVPGGGSIPLNVTGSIARPAVAAAIGKFASKALPVVGLLGAGVALYDLGQELGFNLDNSSGELVVSVPSPGACTTAPCYSYQCLSGNYCGAAGRKNSPIEAAQVVIGQNQYGCKAATVSVRMHPSSPGDWQYNGSGVTYPSGPGTCSLGWNNLGKYSRAPDTEPTFNPSTAQEFEDAIAARSGWPTSSALARATVDAINSVESLAVEPQTVTGPATSPGPVTVTTTGPQGETTTSTTTHNHTYAGPTVTTTTTTTIVTINNQTGAETGHRVITETPVVPAPAPTTPAEPAPFDDALWRTAMPLRVEVAVDETGMKTPDQIKIDQADNTLDDWDSFVTDIIAALPAFPTIAWDFALPTACGVIPLPAFSPMIESIDVCQFQPMFHELMTVVWTLGGLFGAISLFMRSSLSN